MILDQIIVGPLQVNCYIVGDEETREAAVIDPGGSPQKVLALLARHRLHLKVIINTHAHFDHVQGVGEVRKATGARFLLHRADLPILQRAPQQMRLWLGQEGEAAPEPDGFLDEGDLVPIGGIALRVLHVPGHSPGSIALVEEAGKHVFVGDVLFAGSIGRTDIPGGDFDTLMASLRDKLLTLDDAYQVWPGHGPSTTIGQERRTNPFLNPEAQAW